MKIQYKRHGDNGFVMYVDGQPSGIFKIKKWMNGLIEWQGVAPVSRPNNRFSTTQFLYNGQFE